MPVGTVKIVEYSGTGLVETIVKLNAKLDTANARLMSVGDFIRKAKEAERKANQGVDKP